MDDKIRILQIGMHDKIGGVETYLMNYYRHINREKIQFDFISIYDHLCFEDEIKSLGGKVYKITSEKKNPIKYCKELKSIIKSNNYQIVHINMLSAANILPIIVCKKAKVKNIILHSHNTNTPSGLARKILDRINRPFMRKATHYFACSKKAGEWLFNNKKNLEIVYNAVDKKTFSFNNESRNRIRRELGINDEFLIGHIGRFSYQKNHEFLIDTFYEIQKTKNVKLLLIGEGEAESAIKQKVENMGISSKVIFLGITNKTYDYLSSMDLFVLPSRFEGLPVTAIEAQINGLKCFFSSTITEECDISNNSEFIDLDVNKWVESFNRYYENRLKRDNYLDVDLYDIEKQSMRLQKKYESMLNMNVLHVLYDLGKGGVEKVLENYLFGFEKINNFIVTQKISDEEVKIFFENNGFKIYPINSKKSGIISYYKNLKKIIKNERIDIIHSHMTMGNFFPNMVAFFSGVKYRISHSHFAYCKNDLKSCIYRKLGVIFSNRYIACTKSAAEYLFGKKCNNAFILKNAIMIDDFLFNLEKRNAKRKELGITDEFVIGNVARFTYQKNHKYLLELFSKFSKNCELVKLLLVGDGELKEQIESLAKRLNIDDKIIYLKNRSDVNELMMAMDVFVFPTLFEGLGIVLIEAQASGLHCISSTNVPVDVNITNNIELIELENDEAWLKSLQEAKKKNINRIIDKELFEQQGYDINIERDKLFKYYLNIGGVNND